jgi:phospholipid/cholesterol/gamma-HCH transport system ATP-binding protein
MSDATTTSQECVGVRVEGLRKSFGDHEILKGIDLEVRPGEIFVIMGPSGSGKSVLLKHLIGLERPDGGDIFIDGRTTTAWPWCSSPARCSIP